MTWRAVFLDRDGVLVETIVRNNRAFAPVSLDEFRLEAGAADQVARLGRAGLLTIVVTNQPELARGLIASETLWRMHELLAAEIPVQDIFVCVHEAGDGCGCRKPKPGLLLAAAVKWGIDLKRSFIIGDRGSDMDAGYAVGCHTILLERSYSSCERADDRVGDLASAVNLVLKRVEG